MNALAGPLYIITGVLLLAGFAKAARPSPTATALRELHVPRPLQAARLLGVGEIVLTIAAFITGSAILWAAIAAAYLTFTAFIFWALQGNGAVGSCGCFGQEDTPPTPGHAAFNAAGFAIAALAALDPVSISDFTGSTMEAVTLALIVVTGIALSIAALTTLPRTLALANGTAAPTVQTFSRGRS